MAFAFNPPYRQLKFHTCQVEKSVLYPPCNFTTVFIFLSTCRTSLHVGLKVELECSFLTLEKIITHSSDNEL